MYVHMHERMYSYARTRVYVHVCMHEYVGLRVYVIMYVCCSMHEYVSECMHLRIYTVFKIKNVYKLFWSEFRQISINFNNF